MIKKNVYKATFKNGLHNPVTVEAMNKLEATKEALAAFRKDIYFCDPRPAEEIIETIVEA